MKVYLIVWSICYFPRILQIELKSLVRASRQWNILFEGILDFILPFESNNGISNVSLRALTNFAKI